MNTDCLSRKAVLDTLDTTDKFLDEDRTVENYKALLKECYEVLTPVTPPSEDCVSRQAVLERIDDWWGMGITSTSGELTLCDCIRDLPSVTPTRKKGKWIDIDKTHSKCDKCESVFEIVSANGESNYCPNCGCFMSEGEKE